MACNSVSRGGRWETNSYHATFYDDCCHGQLFNRIFPNSFAWLTEKIPLSSRQYSRMITFWSAFVFSIALYKSSIDYGNRWNMPIAHTAPQWFRLDIPYINSSVVCYSHMQHFLKRQISYEYDRIYVRSRWMIVLLHIYVLSSQSVDMPVGYLIDGWNSTNKIHEWQYFMFNMTVQYVQYELACILIIM